MEQIREARLPLQARDGLERLFEKAGRKFTGRAEELIPMLQSVQKTMGYLPEEALLEIARLTGLSAARIYGTATFYSQFRFKPMGRHLIKVCRGTACHVKGSSRMLDDIQDYLSIAPGQTSADGLFSLETVACFGSCALAPIIVIGDTVYGSMDRTKALQLLEGIRCAADNAERIQ